MSRRDPYDAYEAEAETLGRIGRLFVEADLPRIEVRLPRDLAEAAVAAWEREEDESPLPADESCDERLIRYRAAALSLIGLSISDGGRWAGDEVVVALDPVFIGNAVDASDELPPS